MIENRFRLEKQILLGRQAVRKLLKPGLAPPLPSTSAEGAAFLPEPPMSMDTDAENAFARGAEHFWRRGGNRFVSPQPDTGASPSRTPETRQELRRRKAVSELFVVDERDSPPQTPRAAITSPPSPKDGARSSTVVPEPINPPSPKAFFSRLRTPSFPSMPSPFASMRKSFGESQDRSTSRPSSVIGRADQWSSDSSSEGEGDWGSFGARRSGSRLELVLEDRDSGNPVSAIAERDEGWSGDEPEVDV